MELWGRDELALQRRAFRFAEMQAAATVLCAVVTAGGCFGFAIVGQWRERCAMVRRASAFLLGVVMLAALAGEAVAEARRALIIGINDYQNVPRLQKAVGDAQAMKAKLEALGFKVDLLLNPDYRQLNLGMSAFAQKLQRDDVALVHFSGHGVALDGENYLLPADVPSPATADKELLKSSGFTLSGVIERMRAPGTSAQLLFIDACRDNPYAKNSTRSIGIEGGLVEQPRRPKGTFITYSAGIGQTAADRLSDSDPEPTSVFMRELLTKMSVQGKSIIDLVREVREDVEAVSATMRPPHEQRPAYYDELAGNFFFVPPGGNVAVVVPPRPQPEPAPVPRPVPVNPTPTPAPVPVAMSPPSFDCRTARNADEQAICGNAALAALDRTLSSLYYGLADRLPADARVALRREEGDWLGRRRACADAVPCIAQAYNTRIAELQQRGSGGYTPPPAPAPMPPAVVRPGFDCRSARQPDEIAVCNDSTLAAKDIALTNLYNRLKASLNPDGQRQLAANEAPWLKSRAQCGALASLHRPSLRPAYPAIAGSTRRALTASRPPVQHVARRRRDAGENLSPFAVPALAKQAHRRIPRAVVAIAQPAPVGHAAQRDEDRPAERTGEMCAHRINRDDEIETGHHRRDVRQRIGAEIGIVDRPLDAIAEDDVGNLRAAGRLLQRDKPHARDVGERRESGERCRAGCAFAFHSALPGDADLESAAEAVGPLCDTGRLGGEVVRLRGDGIRPDVQTPHHAQEWRPAQRHRILGQIGRRGEHIDARQRPQQRRRLGIGEQRYVVTATCQQCGVARELHGVAETLLRQEHQAVMPGSLAVPGLIAQRHEGGAARIKTPLVMYEAFRPIALPHLHIGERDGDFVVLGSEHRRRAGGRRGLRRTGRSRSPAHRG